MTMNNTTSTFAPITNWISRADAQAMRKELIANGMDKKQVKLSSYRWADIKDRSKGYICRVLAVKGLRPDLEATVVTKRKAKTTKDIATTCDSSNSMVGEVKYASATDWTATA